MNPTRLAELCLFQRPIFAIEHVGFADRLEFADGFGVADAFYPSFRRCRLRWRRRVWCGPRPNRPRPGTSTTRGSGIELVLDAAGAFVVALEIFADSARRIRSPHRAFARPNSSSLPGSACGKTSGQFLVRMVWSGVITPAWLSAPNSLAPTKFRTASLPRNSKTSRRQAPSTVRPSRCMPRARLARPRRVGAVSRRRGRDDDRSCGCGR